MSTSQEKGGSDERELLKTLSEKLYAGFHIYAAAFYALWLIVLNAYLLWISTRLYPVDYSWLASAVYWGVAAVLAVVIGWRYLGAYGARLEAKAGIARGKAARCRVFHALWASFLVLMPASTYIGSLLGSIEAGMTYSILLAVTVGNWGVALSEACYHRLTRSGHKPIACIPALTLTIASLFFPVVLVNLGWAAWLYMMASIGLAYSLATVAYTLAALKRVA